MPAIILCPVIYKFLREQKKIFRRKGTKEEDVRERENLFFSPRAHQSGHYGSCKRQARGLSTEKHSVERLTNVNNLINSRVSQVDP